MSELTINQKIGSKIKFLRKASNLTQVQLADELNIHTKHLSNIENGRKSVTIAILDKLCKIFNKPHVYFFDFVEYEIREDNNEKELLTSATYMLKHTDAATLKKLVQTIRIFTGKR